MLFTRNLMMQPNSCSFFDRRFPPLGNSFVAETEHCELKSVRKRSKSASGFLSFDREPEAACDIDVDSLRCGSSDHMWPDTASESSDCGMFRSCLLVDAARRDVCERPHADAPSTQHAQLHVKPTQMQQEPQHQSILHQQALPLQQVRTRMRLPEPSLQEDATVTNTLGSDSQAWRMHVGGEHQHIVGTPAVAPASAWLCSSQIHDLASQETPTGRSASKDSVGFTCFATGAPFVWPTAKSLPDQVLQDRSCVDWTCKATCGLLSKQQQQHGLVSLPTLLQHQQRQLEKPMEAQSEISPLTSLPHQEMRVAQSQASPPEEKEVPLPRLLQEQTADISETSSISIQSTGEAESANIEAHATAVDAESTETLCRPELGESTPGSQTASADSSERVLTTVMIRNLPLDVSQASVLKAMDESGFEGLYDFCYLPRSFHTGENHGYAFVNFTASCIAKRFIDSWHRQRPFGGTEILKMSMAAVQGLEANKKRWCHVRRRRIRNPELRPFLAATDSSALLLAPLLPLPCPPR
jgi:hypothetical protein